MKKVKKLETKKQEELNLFNRFKDKEEREELKTLPGILTVSMRYRDLTCCLH